MKHWYILFVALLLPSLGFAERVKKVQMKRDQIVQVKTALGVATIIQVADSPTSLVVGDNEAFKVEFLEQAITIKPLHANAKSNLYIYTEYRRFDVQLITTSEPNADYVVYVENVTAPLKLKPIVKWKKTSLELKNDDLRFRIKRFGQSELSIYVEFEVKSEKDVTVDPASLWISQSKATVPIQRLVLSNFKIGRLSPAHGVVEILKDELNLSKAFSFEVRRRRSTAVDFPKVIGW